MEMFARVAAHELMEPLIAAETRARLVAEQLDDRVDEHTHSDLSELLRAISRMRLLVETLLHEARSSGEPLKRRPVNLERLVAESIALLQSEIDARDARMLANDLPVVRGDGVLLSVLINNLLVNALRYGPRKRGEVRIEARREGPDWRVSVTSQGPTMPTEDRARIFEPYCRGTHERRRVAGAGLGLTICRSIVDHHDGVIGVEPLPGGGNCFYFTLPATGRRTKGAARTPRTDEPPD